MKSNKKRILANKLLSNKERSFHVPPYDSNNWEARKKAIEKRIADTKSPK